GAHMKEKLYVLDRPLEALRDLRDIFLPANGATVSVESSQWGMLTPVISFVTPAAIQLTLFFATLIFFLATQMDFRRYVASFITTRNGKLRFIRITNEIESYLVSYVTTVTTINVALGAAVAIGAWLFGFPTPIIFGVLAALLNFMPYIGAAC